GNSLIDDPAVAGDLAFSWETEFPQVFAKGGFDVVIGNPPYVQSHALDEATKNSIYSTYLTAEYQINTYAVFIERIITILSNDSLYSVIIPNYWLSTQYDARLRELVFLQHHCYEILNVFSVFEDATVDTLILTGQKNQIPVFPKTTFINAVDKELKTIQERLGKIADKLWKISQERNF